MSPFRSPRFRRAQLRFERIGQSRDDFVLHVDEISERTVETLGPEIVAADSFDQLDIDAHAWALR